jgi:hypothetical protein
VSPISRPAAELPSHQDLVGENAALRAELAAASKKSARVEAAASRAKKAIRSPRRRATSEG